MEDITYERHKWHHYDYKLAAKIGVAKAVILNCIEIHLKGKKRRNESILRHTDGKYYHWVYNGPVGWSKLLPEFSPDKIKRLLVELENMGFLIVNRGFKTPRGYSTRHFTTKDFVVETNGDKLSKNEPNHQGKNIPTILNHQVETTPTLTVYTEDTLLGPHRSPARKFSSSPKALDHDPSGAVAGGSLLNLYPVPPDGENGRIPFGEDNSTKPLRPLTEEFDLTYEIKDILSHEPFNINLDIPDINRKINRTLEWSFLTIPKLTNIAKILPNKDYTFDSLNEFLNLVPQLLIQYKTYQQDLLRQQLKTFYESQEHLVDETSYYTVVQNCMDPKIMFFKNLEECINYKNTLIDHTAINFVIGYVRQFQIRDDTNSLLTPSNISKFQLINDFIFKFKREIFTSLRVLGMHIIQDTNKCLHLSKPLNSSSLNLLNNLLETNIEFYANFKSKLILSVTTALESKDFELTPKFINKFKNDCISFKTMSHTTGLKTTSCTIT